MKQVIAYIKTHKLDDVSLALHQVPGFPGMSVLKIQGVGSSRGEPGAGEDYSYRFRERLKLEISCPDALVDPIVSAIAASAHTGLPGDGKIYVLPVEDALRIRTGERGPGVDGG
ncbi:MAG TPA: P-II family nitrogen regulator [Gammaproteobacteria bacterium]|nr:P-II family nitrogen regulator [Gammaproteobacteria bacterium]